MLFGCFIFISFSVVRVLCCIQFSTAFKSADEFRRHLQLFGSHLGRYSRPANIPTAVDTPITMKLDPYNKTDTVDILFAVAIYTVSCDFL